MVAQDALPCDSWPRLIPFRSSSAMSLPLGELLAPWSAHDVAALIGTDAQRVMEIRRGNLTRFSLETLIRYATRLGRRVEVRISDR